VCQMSRREHHSIASPDELSAMQVEVNASKCSLRGIRGMRGLKSLHDHVASS
jgi:hypothetical protein